MHGFHYKLLHDQECIGIKDGMLRLRKTSGTYKDFGTLYLVREFSQLHNYNGFFYLLQIPQSLALLLMPSTAIFCSFPKSISGKRPSFPLSLRFTHIIFLQSSDYINWIILPKFQERFCNLLKFFGSTSMPSQTKCKQSQLLLGQCTVKPQSMSNLLSFQQRVMHLGKMQV